jgi:hypothetical protein
MEGGAGRGNFVPKGMLMESGIGLWYQQVLPALKKGEAVDQVGELKYWWKGEAVDQGGEVVT